MDENPMYALALMYEQYCSDEGHLFMSAGEIASRILVDNNILKCDQYGRGKIDFTIFESENYEDILKRKVAYYGNTEFAHHSARSEYRK